MASPRRTPAAPPELPGFTYERLLGSGGFSDVYLYEQHLPRRRVAVKVLLGGDDLNDTSRQAFIGEANVMAQMSSHPYIVTIFHADVANDGRPYFVMEYAPGRSLSERYKTEWIPIEEVLRTGIRIASAVATAHSVGVLHRDIKPANILTNDFGWPALTDFGISSAVDDELADAAEATDPAAGGTAPGMGMSVPWSPPEMFDDDPQPSVRSEVFSLGATVYTLVASQTPFEVRGRKNGTIDLIGRIERGEITPIARTDVPPALVEVLHRAMALRPAARFATAVEFARALQRVELELGFPATAIDVPNLQVPTPDRPAPGTDDDETSLRSVSVIQAQQPAATVVHEGGRVDGQDRTSTRNVIRVSAQETSPVSTVAPPTPNVAPIDRPPTAGVGPAPAPAPTLGSLGAPNGGGASPFPAAPTTGAGDGRTRAAPTADPARRRNRVVLIVAGITVAILVGAALLGGLLFPDDTTAGPTGSPECVGCTSSAPPTPTSPTAVRLPDGTIAFGWANPQPMPGDVFYWSVVEGTTADGGDPGASTGRTPTSEPKAVVTPYDPGVKVCISVEILRSGKFSPDPLIACTQD